MAEPRKPKDVVVKRQGRKVKVLVIEKSQVVVYIPALEREFDFSFLLPICPASLTRKLSIALGKYFASGFARGTVLDRFGYFKGLISHITSDPVLLSKIKAGTTATSMGDVGGWELCLSSWFNAGLAKHRPDRLTTFGEAVNGLRRIFLTLQRNGFVPQTKFPDMPSNYHIGKGRRLSLIETKKRDGLFVDIIDLVKDRARELGAVDDVLDENYVRNLSDRVPSQFILSREAYVSAMKRVNAELLLSIRNLAEKKLIEGYEAFKEGRKFIGKAEARDVAYLNKLIQDYNEGKPVEGILAGFRAALLTQGAEKAIAVLLAYFSKHGRGVAFVGLRDDKAMNVFLNDLYEYVGGVRKLTKMLGGDPDTTAAAMLLYMVDSGANPSVATELRPDCLQTTDDANQMQVDSVKGRAGWSPIVHTFDRREPDVAVTVPQAIEMTLEMTDVIRQGFPAFSNTLFLFRWFEEPSVATVDFLGDRLRYFVRDAALDADIYKLEGIRQSFILDRTLEADGNTRLAELVAAHKKDNGTTTKIYTDRLPVRLLLSKRIADFQKLFEVDLLFNGAGLEEAFGVTRLEAMEILKKAERTGHGLRCRNPRGGVGPTSTEGDDCNDVGAPCLGCAMKLLFVDKAAIRDIVRQKARLEKMQLEQEANRTRQWEAEGLPLLAFSIAAIEKLRRSPHAALLKTVIEEETQGGPDARS